MATVTGFTAERMLEIEDASVVDGEVDGAGQLILTRHDGTQINAGMVIGPTGPAGPVGEDTDVLAALPVLDVGLANQIRAGRHLFASDFSDIGLTAPIGLWNLSNVNDSSGFGRNLINKGSVTFVPGVNGLATTAAQFVGNTAQALYIADTGAADPFRIKVGSFGGWFKTDKSGAAQALVSKRGAAGQIGWWLGVSSGDVAFARISGDGTATQDAVGVTKICDGRWHHIMVTFDANLFRIYVDGVVEDTCLHNFTIFGSNAPLNIGSYGADAGVAATDPHFGRIDEVFVSSDVFTPDQVRYMYCAKIQHGLGEVPSRVTLNIRRRTKRAALASADFPALPLRLYNFSAGSLANEGSDGAAGNLTNTGPAVAANNAFHFVSARLTTSDAGLPDALLPHSFGCWFKTVNVTTAGYIITWGTTNGTNDSRLYVDADGFIVFGSGANAITGPFVADGEWHHAAIVHDNAAADGVKRKLYLDGRLVATSLVMNSVTLGGANKFVIGMALALNLPFLGSIDSVFIEDAAYTFEDVMKIYTKSGQEIPPSPKNVGDHIEALTQDFVIATFDTLDVVSRVDLKVAP